MSAIFAVEPDSTPAAFGRRSFLKATAATAAGFTIGFRWAGPTRRALAAAAGAFEPNAFLRVAPDNSVTVIAKHLEMGQGSYTGLATIVATHNMDLAARMDRRVTLRDGLVVELA